MESDCEHLGHKPSKDCKRIQKDKSEKDNNKDGEKNNDNNKDGEKDKKKDDEKNDKRSARVAIPTRFN